MYLHILMLNIICLKYGFYHLQLKIQQMYQSPEIKYYPLSVSKKCLKLRNPTIILVYIVISKWGRPV